MNKQLLWFWIRATEDRAPNGWKPSGLEYRIMQEAGIVQSDMFVSDEFGIGQSVIKAVDAILPEYVDELLALKLYAERFVLSDVKRRYRCDTRTAHRLINTGYAVLIGGFLNEISGPYAIRIKNLLGIGVQKQK